MKARLILKDGAAYEGASFGAPVSIAGEVVFTTGMVGYPESLTDPSYRGQILVLTYPLVGNYGVPDKKTWESGKIQVAGLIVSSYINTPSHHSSQKTLGQWLKEEGVPALEISDTRGLTLRLRDKGAILGKIEIDDQNVGAGLGRPRIKNERLKAGPALGVDFEDPNLRNLSAEVSIRKPKTYGSGSSAKLGTGKKTVLLLDCGVKQNIIRELVKRQVKVIVAPWDFDPFAKKIKFHGLLISNGPGDPKMCRETIAVVKKVMLRKIPIFGICLGNQILALAAGGDTAKMKFGHRGQNQPVGLVGSKKCFLTTQNHGFEVKKVPSGFNPWFKNLNDQTNEGIIHK